jgi:hypothetical protein
MEEQYFRRDRDVRLEMSPPVSVGMLMGKQVVLRRIDRRIQALRSMLSEHHARMLTGAVGRRPKRPACMR